MAAKVTVEVENLDEILRKLDWSKYEPEMTQALSDTAGAAAGMLRSLVGRRTGTLAGSINPTGVSDRGRGRARGGPMSGRQAAFVTGVWYGRFPDRGTIYIKARKWSARARTQVKPTADANLRKAGNDIGKKWAR